MGTEICSQADEKRIAAEEQNAEICEMIHLGTKLNETLQEIIEKENELLKRLDQLIQKLEQPLEASPFIESESVAQKHSVFITGKREKHKFYEE